MLYYFGTGHTPYPYHLPNMGNSYPPFGIGYYPHWNPDYHYMADPIFAVPFRLPASF